MATKILAMLVLVALSFILALGSGCGSSEVESQPYGPPQVHFPQDEGAHPESGIEWWYLNSILTDPEGREYGAMVAYFNPGLKILSISDIEAERSYPEVSFSIPDYAEGTLDLEERREIMGKLQKIQMERGSIAIAYWMNVWSIANIKVQNFKGHPTAYDLFTDVWIKQP